LILFKPSRDALVRQRPQVHRVVLAFLLHFLFVLAGMDVVPGYLGFGLAEVIFWSVKGSLFMGSWRSCSWASA
jgi:hypothetical protein